MDAEDVINLFDSFWFSYEILKKKSSFSYTKVHQSSSSSSSEPRFSSLRSILVRSQSEDVGSFNYGSFSPKSVLLASHEGSIPSRKSIFSTHVQEQEQEQEQEHEERVQEVKMDSQEDGILQERKKNKNKNKRKKKRCDSRTSKSLSELEFEELKGFMDLGFVFSEQDKDSSLVDIIPGLQRLGQESGDDQKSCLSSNGGATRPYLSEAWKDLDRNLNKKKTMMMNWEIPCVRDEIDMKDNLKLWAHTVASIVR